MPLKAVNKKEGNLESGDKNLIAREKEIAHGKRSLKLITKVKLNYQMSLRLLFLTRQFNSNLMIILII
jgi:hypothetical protein